MPLDSWTRRLISEIELDSSSDAAAAARTCSDAVSDADADSAGQIGGGARRLGQLARDALEIAGGVHDLVDHAADAGLELVDEAPQFGLASIVCSRGIRGLLIAKALALGGVALEHRDRARDLADLIGAVVAIDLDIMPAVGDRRQRLRHRRQRPGDAANDQHGQDQHEQRRHRRRNRHGLDRMREHRIQLLHGNADIDDADDLSGRIRDREIRRHERLAEQGRRPLIGLAPAQHGLSRMVGGQLGADGAIAVFLFHIGGAAHELFGGVVIDEQGRVAADIADRAIDDRVILELRHCGDLDLADDAVLQGDLGVLEGFTEGQREGAEIDLDVAERPVPELVGQRPIARADHQRGIDADQQHGGHHRLGAEPEFQGRQEFPDRTHRCWTPKEDTFAGFCLRSH